MIGDLVLPTDFPLMRGPVTRSPVRLWRESRPKGRTFLETIFRDSVRPALGSVVCCDLAGAFEHSGIYVGRNRIIHRDGDGFLAAVSPEEFLARLGGCNPAKYIHVSCDDDGDPVGGRWVAERARGALKKPNQKSGYNLLTKNCHQFCQYCLTGDEDASVFNCSFTSLEEVMKDELYFTNWRRWDF